MISKNEFYSSSISTEDNEIADVIAGMFLVFFRKNLEQYVDGKNSMSFSHIDISLFELYQNFYVSDNRLVIKTKDSIRNNVLGTILSISQQIFVQCDKNQVFPGWDHVNYNIQISYNTDEAVEFGTGRVIKPLSKNSSFKSKLNLNLIDSNFNSVFIGNVTLLDKRKWNEFGINFEFFNEKIDSVLAKIKPYLSELGWNAVHYNIDGKLYFDKKSKYSDDVIGETDSTVFVKDSLLKKENYEPLFRELGLAKSTEAHRFNNVAFLRFT